MTELGDFLQLLNQAGGTFSTLHAEYRGAQHGEVAERAIGEALKRSRGTVIAGRKPAASERPDADATEPAEELGRVWMDTTGRYREQLENRAGTTVFVRDGERWWSYEPTFGATSNAEDGPGIGSLESGSYEALVKPSSLPGELWFEFDAEHGVGLRAVARFRGELLGTLEAVTVAYDQPLPDDTFVFVEPEGSAPQFEPPVRPEPVALDAAGERAPFSVFVLTGMPDGWAPMAMFAADRQRPPRPAELTVMYVAPDGGGTVIVRQQSEADAAAVPGAEHPVERTVDRGGGAVSVLEPSAGFATVRAVRDGTRVEISSADLDVERLLELTGRLAPSS